MERQLTALWEFKVQKYTEAEKTEEKLPDGILGVCEGLASVCDIENDNDRTYTRPLWKTCFGRDETKKRLELRNIVGQLGHPADQADPSRVSHVTVVQELREDGTVFTRDEILDTPMGRILHTFYKAKIGIGTSSRGFGEEDANGDVDESSYRLEAWDRVFNPSFMQTIGNQKLVASRVVDILQSALDEGEKFDKTTAKRLLEAIGTKKAKRLVESMQGEKETDVTDDQKKVYEGKIASLAKEVGELTEKLKEAEVGGETDENKTTLEEITKARDDARARADVVEGKYAEVCKAAGDLRDRYLAALTMLKEAKIGDIAGRFHVWVDVSPRELDSAVQALERAGFEVDVLTSEEGIVAIDPDFEEDPYTVRKAVIAALKKGGVHVESVKIKQTTLKEAELDGPHTRKASVSIFVSQPDEDYEDLGNIIRGARDKDIGSVITYEDDESIIVVGMDDVSGQTLMRTVEKILKRAGVVIENLEIKQTDRKDEAASKAQRDYLRTWQEVSRALKDLDKEMAKHASEADIDPENWGYQGDLSYVLDLISQAVSFLRGKTPKMATTQSQGRRTDEQVYPDDLGAPNAVLVWRRIGKLGKGVIDVIGAYKDWGGGKLAASVTVTVENQRGQKHGVIAATDRSNLSTDAEAKKWLDQFRRDFDRGFDIIESTDTDDARKDEQPAPKRTDEATQKKLKESEEKQATLSDQLEKALMKADSQTFELHKANIFLGLSPMTDKEQALLDSAGSGEALDRAATEIKALRQAASEADSHLGQALDQMAAEGVGVDRPPHKEGEVEARSRSVAESMF